MLTHVDNNGLPSMVDITEKNITKRQAVAQCLIQLTSDFRELIKDDEIFVKKGPVFQTAIIAGTQAVKKTYDVIPFCHAIPIESCKFEINLNDDLLIKIVCTVGTTFKTGVEMEALHGVSVAALTVYDMCKAQSKELKIIETKLVSKSGGKSDFRDD